MTTPAHASRRRRDGASGETGAVPTPAWHRACCHAGLEQKYAALPPDIVVANGITATRVAFLARAKRH